ncbi:MAG: iron ABC transporter permease [Bryobacteraceae bacterium]|nr:iron ABC transporter permease [Bryobacteraceae bacterium]
MGTKPLTPGRAARILAAAALLALAVMLVTPLAGPVRIDLLKAWRGEFPDAQMFFGVRWPRTLLAMLSGGALALAGVLFQALLRDPLASPFTLGVSSGASLGAVLMIVLGLHTVWGLPALWLGAALGALAVLVVVVSVAAEGRRVSSFTLLLAGVAINSIASSLIMLLHNLATVGQSFAIVHWLMGNIDPVPAPTLAGLALIVLPVSVAACATARQWNLMAVGEEWAAARGASPQRLLLGGYLAGSVLAAAVTAVTGPIGFVGLVVPHALRLRIGSDHRVLMPASFLVGGAFLALCDTAARTLLSVELPVSVVTALVGGPVFIFLLRSRRRSLWL